jgi:hypothetical protein
MATAALVIAERISLSGIFDLFSLLFLLVSAFIFATSLVPWFWAGAVLLLIGILCFRKAGELRTRERLVQQGILVDGPPRRQIQFHKWSATISTTIGVIVILVAIYCMVPYFAG